MINTCILNRKKKKNEKYMESEEYQRAIQLREKRFRSIEARFLKRAKKPKKFDIDKIL